MRGQLQLRTVGLCMRALWLKHSDAQYSLGVSPLGFMVTCCQATLHKKHTETQKTSLQRSKTVPHPSVKKSLLIYIAVVSLWHALSGLSYRTSQFSFHEGSSSKM